MYSEEIESIVNFCSDFGLDDVETVYLVNTIIFCQMFLVALHIFLFSSCFLFSKSL